MKKIWIFPVCRSSSTRKSNLKVHIKKCHSDVVPSPIAYDPLTGESSVPKPADMTYFRESFPSGSIFNKETKIDEEERPSWVRKQTRMLNELSDYGDAYVRFKKHAPVSIDPMIFAVSMASIPYYSQRTMMGINYSSQGAMAESYTELANRSSASRFLGFTGYICKMCGEVTVIFVSEFPPEKTAHEHHLITMKKEKPLPRLTPSLYSLQDELVDQLLYFVKTAFEGKIYLYCKRLDIEENFWTVTQNREAIEAKMRIPDKFNRVRMAGLRTNHWAVRAYKHGRTEISEIEVAQFLKKAQATYAISWAHLDGLPEYYFMWIDEDMPNLRMESAEILRRLSTA